MFSDASVSATAIAARKPAPPAPMMTISEVITSMRQFPATQLIDPFDPSERSLAQPSAADIDLRQLRTAQTVGVKAATGVFRTMTPDAMPLSGRT
jgi:hypothetical protein